MQKVKVGESYVYQPVLIDRVDPKTSIPKGAIVTAIKSPRGCPPINTMAHCYVAFNGRFAGLVHVNSLQPLNDEGSQCPAFR